MTGSPRTRSKRVIFASASSYKAPRMLTRLGSAVGTAVLVGGLVLVGPAAAAPPVPGPSSPASGPASSPGATHPKPPVASACGAPGAQHAFCGALQLLDPSENWRPGPAGGGPGGGPAGGPGGPNRPGGGSAVPPPPSSGYYPGDLQSAYGLADAAAGFSPGPSAPTVAIVDAYDDPNAASDLAAYRASLSKATDQNTGIADAAIPPLCSSTVTTGCVTFTKVNQSGGKTYPPGNAGWAQEISLDLDMVSAICPNCNIVLVEASTSSFANLATAVSYAKSLHPAAITNSYGGGEFSSETSYNSTYSGTATTAITAASGDNGFGVEYPAASPGLTAVGGTSLSYDRTTSGLTWTQSVWSSAGSGCSSYEPMPSWQADQGVYSLSSDCTGRQTADVAAVANPSTGVAVYDTYSETGWLVFGGTSVSTQIIGATYALAAGSSTVQAAPSALYVDSLSASATGPTTGIVPVTTGSNATCGDYLCDAADSLSSGYNGPAGLGTPYGVSAFITSATTSTGFGLTVTPASATVTQGNVTSYTVTVSPSGGFDSSVSLAVSGVPSGANSTFTPSSATSPSWSSTLSVTTTTSTTAGTYTLVISGTSGSLTSQTDVTLTVQAAQTAASMQVTLSAGKATKKGPHYKVPLTVSASDASTNSPLDGASVALQIFAGSTCSGTVAGSGTGTTGTNGQFAFSFSTGKTGEWCATATVTDTGYNPGSAETTFNT